MTHAAVLLLVAAGPVPPARPDLTEGEEAELRAVKEELRRWKERLRKERLGHDPATEAERSLHRRAAGRLDRLLATLGGRSRSARHRVAREAGQAWLNAGEYDRAAPCLDLAARTADRPYERITLLRSALACQARMGRPAEARRRLEPLRREVAKMPADRRRPQEERARDVERWIDSLDPARAR